MKVGFHRSFVNTQYAMRDQSKITSVISDQMDVITGRSVSSEMLFGKHQNFDPPRNHSSQPVTSH
jgi:hypothetical protein